jgi:16S rRNA (uracil1498-N3)-methyltransferase
MRRFYIHPDNLKKTSPVLIGSEAKHIANVLRLKVGDGIGLFDGKGNEYEAVLVSVSTQEIEVSITRRYPGATESPVQITIAQALLKDQKMDRLIRQLTELGVYRFIPYASKRSIPIPDPRRFEARKHRWNKIIVEAMKQCHRSRILEIDHLETFSGILNRNQQFDLKVLFWENETSTFDLTVFKTKSHCRTILAMMGPEGGFTLEEVQQARADGFISASLGPRTLKAETASIASGVLLQYHFGDMGQKAVDKNIDL